ncbi:MAG: transcription termination factor NusA [Verrucomicrobia bacterium]|nr:transcription termination factor NusA [Verrucomicrobiota bacterium]MBU4290674.1 transcription termination factor NusA [Verrucomicrobiota bacterium]MBU4429384.1 transcription termination factor NusA [Verrucomicrobiota bacterium]MCG2681153.1 transcription termination factor NusA [Kiritimatiellia bacterium]
MSSHELLAVIEHMEKERGIDRASLIQMVEAALMSASKKSVGPAKDFRIIIDDKTLAIRAFAKVNVVDHAQSRHIEISLTEARKWKPAAKIGDEIEIEITTKDFGRIAAQTAKQAIIQKIRQAEKEIVVKEYKDRLGDIVSGTIVRVERGDLIVDLGRVEAIMPVRERVQSEEYQIGDRIRAYILSVQDHISGHHIVLSRSHPNFVKRLFELEISEIADGTVEIKGIAREAGFRTKIAVLSRDEKVDPVGACVGMKGMRVKNVVRELLGEKIDIVRWSADIKTYATNALNPAKLNKVIIEEEEHKVTVIVDTDQLSLAIGKRGQNARLTSKLLGWKINIQKNKDDISFEEKVAMAIEDLTHLNGIDREKAEKLVHAGFLTVEGILDSDVHDLQDTTGFDAATAQAIKEAAVQSAAQKPEPKPDIP